MAPRIAVPQQWPPHVQTFLENITQVESLLVLPRTLRVARLTERDRDRAIIKSGIVLLVACWEAYVEDLASLSFDFMLREAKAPGDIPARVLALAGRPIRDEKDERRMWEIAGDGWRNVLEAHKQAIKAKHIGTLNTPRTSNVDALFSSLLGLQSLSSAWRWRGMSNTRAIAQLEALVTLRGEIAHRVQATRRIKQADAYKLGEHLNRLAVISSNRLSLHLSHLVGRRAWPALRYKSTG